MYENQVFKIVGAKEERIGKSGITFQKMKWEHVGSGKLIKVVVFCSNHLPAPKHKRSGQTIAVSFLTQPLDSAGNPKTPDLFYFDCARRKFKWNANNSTSEELEFDSDEDYIY